VAGIIVGTLWSSTLSKNQLALSSAAAPSTTAAAAPSATAAAAVAAVLCRAIVTADKALLFEPASSNTRKLLDTLVPRLQVMMMMMMMMMMTQP
jgi:hypothetical protein